MTTATVPSIVAILSSQFTPFAVMIAEIARLTQDKRLPLALLTNTEYRIRSSCAHAKRKQLVYGLTSLTVSIKRQLIFFQLNR